MAEYLLTPEGDAQWRLQDASAPERSVICKSREDAIAWVWKFAAEIRHSAVLKIFDENGALVSMVCAPITSKEDG